MAGTIIECVNRITAIESAPDEIACSQRSALDPKAQPYQDLIYALMYKMAGQSNAEAAGLEERLSRRL